MARASGVSLSLRRAGFPVASAEELDAMPAVDRLYDVHVRVAHSGAYTTGSTQTMVWVVGGVQREGDQRAAELLQRVRDHLNRKYPPVPVLGARNGQTRPRVTQHTHHVSRREILYVD